MPTLLLLALCDEVFDGALAVAAAMVVVAGLMVLPPSNGLVLLVRSLAELPAALPPLLGAIPLLNDFFFWYSLSRSRKDIGNGNGVQAAKIARLKRWGWKADQPVMRGPKPERVSEK